jgi:hypothetical protein
MNTASSRQTLSKACYCKGAIRNTEPVGLEKPFAWQFCGNGLFSRAMNIILRTAALLAMVLAASENSKAATVVIEDNNWDSPYWHHHHYGYWHHQRGYWTYHHGHHVWVAVP